MKTIADVKQLLDQIEFYQEVIIELVYVYPNGENVIYDYDKFVEDLDINELELFTNRYGSDGYTYPIDISRIGFKNHISIYVR